MPIMPRDMLQTSWNRGNKKLITVECSETPDRKIPRIKRLIESQVITS